MKKFLIAGKRTPFVRARERFSGFSTIQLSVPLIKEMTLQATPDFVLWGQVIPSATVSNIGRELVSEANLSADIPGATSVLACCSSMFAAIQAAGMLGSSDWDLGLVGGVETMSHVPFALRPPYAQKITKAFSEDPAAAQSMLEAFNISAFDLPLKGWVNRISGKSMGEHTEDTAKCFQIERSAQDAYALRSHQAAVSGWDTGFFNDLVMPFAGVTRDTTPRSDSTLEKLASLKPVFDRSDSGTLTAGNSSPLTDGAAGLWVANETGLEQLADEPAAELLDWQVTAMDYHEEGILMAPARAIPKLLARHGLKFEDIALWEIHEAFAAQVLANIKAISDPSYREGKAGVAGDFGDFPWDRLNPNGGSLAIGHPFAATGARILSQAVKELSAMETGRFAIVSICADGGQGSVILLRRSI